MSTVINCSHKFDDWYNYNIEKDIEDENGFEVNVLVRVNETYREARINYNDNDHPAEHDFKIDYDSFEIEFSNHLESEIKMINDWIEIHKQKGTFEESFGKSYYEVE